MSETLRGVWQLAEGLYIEPEDFIEAECEIMFYLHSYGNTKAGDLVKFGVNKFGKDPGTMARMLELMVRRGDLCEVKHDKLKSNATYFALNEPLPTSRMLGANPFPSMTLKEKRRAQALSKKIMTEAAELTEKRMKERFPDSKIR